MANSTLNVTYKTKKTGTGTQDASKELTKLNATVGGLKGAMGALAGSTAIGAVIGGLKFAITQAMEAERVMALTESTIKATGGAAGFTADQIAGMAGKLSLMTGIADDTIQSGQNMLLTFKEIKGDNFERATVAMNDMAVAMNGGSLEGLDLKATAIQLGKALNDPIKGLTALSKVGVSFTDGQRAAIKAMQEAGDVAGAQAIILAELESEFGGAAEAAGNTFAGSLAKLQNAVSELAEALGKELLPGLTDAANAAVLVIQWNDRVTAALSEHEAEVTKTATSYQAYRDEVIRARIASGEYAEQIEVTQLGAIRRLAADTGLLTEAQWKANKAVDAFGVKAHIAGWEAMKLAEAQASAAKSASADAARWQGLADALGVVGEANFELKNKTDDAKEAGKLLAAAMSGTMSSAAADYQSVIAETTPQIAELRAQLDRYYDAQGKTFTVTTAATTSIEEYELAQIKAATAAQKLAEFTGDNREEYLNLKIAADEAATKVGALGESMGISQTFTADYTQQIRDANGTLDELNARQAEAEAQLKRTTAEFIYQQIAANLDAGAALEVGRKLGLVDETSYNVAKSVLDLTAKFDLNRDGMISTAEATPQYLAALNYIQTSAVAAAEGHSNSLTPAVNETKDKLITAAEAAQGYSDKLDALENRTIEQTIITKWVNDGSPPTISDNATTGKATGTLPGPGGADGLNFVVPPGFPNDSFPIRVQSGEHVQVTPADQVRQGDSGGGGTWNVTINAPGATANELYAMLQRDDLRRRTGARR